MKPMGRARRPLMRAVILGVLLAGMVTAVAAAAPFVYVGTGPASGIAPSIFQFAANPATDIFNTDLAPAGSQPTTVAVSADGRSAYLPNAGDATIVVISSAVPLIPKENSPPGSLEAILTVA